MLRGCLVMGCKSVNLCGFDFHLEISCKILQPQAAALSSPACKCEVKPASESLPVIQGRWTRATLAVRASGFLSF